jgi:succinoglycan biosynthesis transport protein ExoP
MLQINKSRLAIIPGTTLVVLALGAGHAFSAPTRLASATVLAVNEDIKSNVADSPGALLTQQQLDELNQQLIQALNLTAESKARLDRITAIMNDEHLDPASDAFATVAEVLNDQVIIKLHRQYLDYGAREADWSRRFGANHLAVVNLRNQMREIRRAILDELHRLAETYRSDYEIAKARADALSQSLEQIERSSR